MTIPMSPESFVIRPGTLADAETVVAHRRAMFLEMGYRDEQALDGMCDAFRPWLARKMRDQQYLAWFAVDSGGEVAAGLGLWLMDWPPHMIGPGPWRANIVNVYTRPQSRRMGLARRLMDTALAWCRVNHVPTVILHSSDDGRRLYESMGFESTNEMRIILELK
ncbi:MAG: GNAT family N-acetyltransferase [Bryobacteraceae bacterium]